MSVLAACKPLMFVYMGTTPSSRSYCTVSSLSFESVLQDPQREFLFRCRQNPKVHLELRCADIGAADVLQHPAAAAHLQPPGVARVPQPVGAQDAPGLAVQGEAIRMGGAMAAPVQSSAPVPSTAPHLQHADDVHVVFSLPECMAALTCIHRILRVCEAPLSRNAIRIYACIHL